MKRKIFNLFVLLVLTFVATIPVNAIENVESNTDLQNLQDQIENTAVITDKATTKQFIQKAKKLVQNKTAKFNIETNKIVFSKAKLVKYSDDESTYYMVGTPVNLKDSHELSNVSIVFKEDGSFLGTTEFYLTKNKDSNFRIAQYSDGVEKLIQDTEHKFETAEEFRANAPQFSTMGFDTTKLAECLGISAALAGTIAAACALGCAFSAGVGCVVCLGVALGFNVGGNGACIKNAWRG